MTSLIKSLALKNFKGFSDEVRIELRPITLLFGANSAGKSSVRGCPKLSCRFEPVVMRIMRPS